MHWLTGVKTAVTTGCNNTDRQVYTRFYTTRALINGTSLKLVQEDVEGD